MPSSSSKMLCHDAQEILMCDLKVVKKAWTEPGPRQCIDHTFDFQFQVQVITVDSELCILNAVVPTTISPTTDDDDDVDNLSDHLNGLVKGVIERETRALAASMTMAEMFSLPVMSVDHQAVAVVGNVQLEIKHLGRLILYDAYIYVKPQFGEALLAFDLDQCADFKPRQDATTTTQTDKVFLNVQADQGEQEVENTDRASKTGEIMSCKLPEPLIPQAQQEVQISAEDGSKEEVEITERPSKTDETIVSYQSPEPLIPQVQQQVQRTDDDMPTRIDQVNKSCRRACQRLKPLVFQVLYGNDTTAGQLERRKKPWRNYTLNTLLFACTMLFSAYMSPSSSTSMTTKIVLVIDIVVFLIINAVHLIKLPNWGNALVCTSCLLLELALCLLVLPFNGWYALAILAVLFLIVVVSILQPMFHRSVKKYVLPSFTTDDDGHTQCDISDQENDYLNHLFDISNGISTCGGMVTGILGYYSYMIGPVTAAGFFFFCTVLLGLYLMMVIAMRAVSTTHAACLTIVLKLLLLLTIITGSISFVHQS